MNPRRLLLVGSAAAAAVIAFWLHHLAAHPQRQPLSAPAPPPPPPSAASAARLPECPDTPDANPLGGPCVPRALRNAPPDPGPDNDKTLAGIDSNRNGVRDDIERYIAANYGDSPQKVAYLMQYAREYLPFVSRAMNSPADALAQSARLSRANACAARLIGPAGRAMTFAELRRFDEWLNAARDMEIQHLNTPDRLARFVQNEKLLAGHGLTLEDWKSVQTACDFPAVDLSAQPQGEKR